MIALLKRQLNETYTILKSFKGNARGCLIAEPLWAIPYNLYAAYASIYMIALGCSEVQVGLIASIGLVLQAFFALVSGYVTDRLGRRKTSLIFDLIGWSIATLIWAFAQNFYYFLAAAIVNSSFRIVHTSWYCLLVEDTEPEERVHVFTWISVAGILAGFIAPAAGFLVGRVTLVPTMRGLYLFAFISMTFMFFLRNRLTTETRIGLVKMEEAKHQRFGQVFNEYVRISIHLLKNPYTLVAFFLMVLNNIQINLKGTFLSILLTKNLKFPEASIAIFPAVNSVVMLVIYLFVMPTLGRFHPKKPLAVGFAVSVLSNLLLILSPENDFLMVTLSTVLGGIGVAVASPFIDTVVANSIADEDRAKILSILNVLLFGISAPFGYIGGLLSSVSEKLPFAFIILVFLCNILIVLILARMEKRDSSRQLSA